MIYFHKSKEVLKEEHLIDLDYQTKKILKSLDLPISEYEKYLIEQRKEFLKEVDRLATLPN